MLTFCVNESILHIKKIRIAQLYNFCSASQIIKLNVLYDKYRFFILLLASLCQLLAILILSNVISSIYVYISILIVIPNIVIVLNMNINIIINNLKYFDG